MRDEIRHAFCFFAPTWFVFVPQAQFCHPFGGGVFALLLLCFVRLLGCVGLHGFVQDVQAGADGVVVDDAVEQVCKFATLFRWGNILSVDVLGVLANKFYRCDKVGQSHFLGQKFLTRTAKVQNLGVERAEKVIFQNTFHAFSGKGGNKLENYRCECANCGGIHHDCCQHRKAKPCNALDKHHVHHCADQCKHKWQDYGKIELVQYVHIHFVYKQFFAQLGGKACCHSVHQKVGVFAVFDKVKQRLNESFKIHFCDSPLERTIPNLSCIFVAKDTLRQQKSVNLCDALIVL